MNLSDFLHANRFIVLGGHKCGTSSLHSYLKQHPEIIMPIDKGLDILGRSKLDIEDYKASYDTHQIINQKTFGEVSSTYWKSETACLSIKKYFPNVKLLAMLRNPVDRAFSHYQVLPDQGKCQVKWEDICQNPQNFNTNRILTNGLYYNRLKLYLDEFKDKEICVLLFDSFVGDQKKFFFKLFNFVGVNQNFIPDTSYIVRKGGQKKGGKLQKIFLSNNFLRTTAKTIIKPFTNEKQRYMLGKKLSNLFVVKRKSPNQLKSNLIDYYREDILKTQDIIDIDLSHWLKT
ncbi:sulfotransferase domain-containing protein [Okeania sp. KiyG1]|uniref:sulfotransferase domain-containing protein n=1 Tax=Okeania sp. KiyG1 TaxID=2720165 RepID=UPI001920A234|nr:sulfotransferase domain-containing protein [Okeania sp. KiyG1]GGA13438.1 sulfotransferase [Okeania sp. KiyG1]